MNAGTKGDICVPDKDLLAQLAKVEPHALATLIDFGPNYFNPLIGEDEAETFNNLEQAVEFLHGLLAKNEDIGEGQRGLALFVQTMWTACQYERDRLALRSAA